MKVKKRKMRIVFLLFVILVLCIPISSVKAKTIEREIYLADDFRMPNWGEIKDQADDFINSGRDEDKIDDSKLQQIVIPVAQMLVTAGSVVLLIVTIVMGIKYMVGGPEKRAQLKQQLIGLVVATIVIFAAQFIWKWVYKFMSDLTVSRIEIQKELEEEFQQTEKIQEMLLG